MLLSDWRGRKHAKNAGAFANLVAQRHMRGMNRRDLLRLSFVPCAVVHGLLASGGALAQARFQPTPQDQADLARIESYLDGLRSMKARFLQVAPDGAITRGVVWLERPGRMRFQYDPPSPLLLVAGHGLVVFYDASVNQTSNFPISSTPLGILLSDHVKLGGGVTVTGMQRAPGQLQVSLVRTASPGDGTLTLVFADNPLVLRQWTVVDAQRKETRVTLYDVQLGGNFDSQLFEFIDPRFGHPGGG
jgi:outer membrane lipoprotein-sorting protein